MAFRRKKNPTALVREVIFIVKTKDQSLPAHRKFFDGKDLSPPLCLGFFLQRERSVMARTRGFFSIEKICHCLHASGDYIAEKISNHLWSGSSCGGTHHQEGVNPPPRGGIDPLLHHPGSVQSESAHPDQLNSQHSQLASEIICSAPRLPPPKQWRANTPLMHAPFKDHQQVTKSHLLQLLIKTLRISDACSPERAAPFSTQPIRNREPQPRNANEKD